MEKQYAKRSTEDLDDAGGYFSRHMTSIQIEFLYDPSDIAKELAYRDMVIDTLKANLKGKNL